MVGELAKWSMNNIDSVFLPPLALTLVCHLLHRLKPASMPIREALYLSTSLSLSASYFFALSSTESFLANVIIVTPQAFILLGMFVFSLARIFFLRTFQTPSPWWVFFVAIVGHGWTRMLYYALSGYLWWGD